MMTMMTLHVTHTQIHTLKTFELNDEEFSNVNDELIKWKKRRKENKPVYNDGHLSWTLLLSICVKVINTRNIECVCVWMCVFLFEKT